MEMATQHRDRRRRSTASKSHRLSKALYRATQLDSMSGAVALWVAINTLTMQLDLTLCTGPNLSQPKLNDFNASTTVV